MVVGVGAAVVLSWTAVLLSRRDPRRLRTGLALLSAIHTSLALLALLARGDRPAGEVLLHVAGAVGVLGTLTLGLTVVISSLAVSRLESGPVGRVLSGLGGIALLAAPWGVAGAAASGSTAGSVAALVSGTIAMHLGLAFLVFLGASLPYQLLRPSLECTGIIVLGSTLRDGRVPPLLRRRLDRAVLERERLLERGLDPLLVPSGGKGDAVTPAESEAMAAYLVEVAGVPAQRVRAETASRTTEENLILSHRLLDDAGHQGPYIIATSGYHAFRAALLARGLGYEDAAVGGATAWTYLPTATLREFVLVLWYRLRGVLASLPLTAGLLALLLQTL